MKHYCLALLCFGTLFCPPCLRAQNPGIQCGTDYWRAQTLQDPDFFEKNEAFEQAMLLAFEQTKNRNGSPEQIRYIPVVVHIIHDNGPENISDAQAQQAIDWLNQALANQGSFDKGSGANCGIQLCLAQRSSHNAFTNGITRNQSALTDMQLESQDILVKNLNRWSPKDYLNIWVVRSICSNTYGCGVYGYANYPYSHGSVIDGIVIEADYVTQLSKIGGLAHETGHYLGLYHTFEGGCTNNNCLLDGDRICDTPPDQSTVAVPCGEFISTCSTDSLSGPFSTDRPDMSWNYMDYGNIACIHDFTPNQATRMNATLDGVRKSLLKSNGCLPICPSMEFRVNICNNAFYYYHGIFFPPDTVAVFHFTSVAECDSMVTLFVQSYPPLSLITPKDTSIRIGDDVLLTAEASGTAPLSFLWSPSNGLSCNQCASPNASPLDTVKYTLAVKDGYGCKVEKSVTLQVSEECRIRVPNAFSPNGDGANERFLPIMDPCVREVLFLQIMNRWGEPVLTQFNLLASDPALGWDGDWNGSPHPSDVLLWRATFEYFDGLRETKHGEVTLVR